MVSMTDEVRHLLVSFPEDLEGDERWAILDGLLLRVMVNLLGGTGSSRLLSQEEVTRRLSTVTGLAFDSGEVQEALERLEDAGKLAFVDRSKKSIALDPEAAQKESERVSKRIDLEQRVRDTWIRDFLERTPDAEAAAGERFWQHLRAALGQLVNARSAEAAAFLYLDQQQARMRFEQILNESRTLSDALQGPEGMPPQLFRSEFARLILAPKDSEADFILSVLTAAFQYHLICLDPAAARLARSVVGSKVFYLDTNFLFRLLALHGPREAHGPALIADLASELSTELRVGRATLHEFKSTVRYRRQELRGTFLQREDFRRIAVDHAGTDLDFMTEFYRQLQSGLVGGVTDFAGKYLQIERALADWGIVVDEQCTWDNDILEGLADRSGQLMTWSSGAKSPSSCDHDVLMEHYVREHRNAHAGGLNDVDVWFLTYDRRLTRFAFGNPIDEEVPAPLLAEDWLQIVRSFSPRTEEYDRAFLALLSSPLLLDDQAVPYSHLVKALSRLERYEGLSPNVVAGMVVEREFVKRMNEPLDAAEERQVVELAMAKVTSRMEAELEETRARAKQAESTRDEAIRERDESVSALDLMRRERDGSDEDVVIPTSDEESRLRRQVTALRVVLTGMIAIVLVIAVVWLWTPPLLGGPTRWRVFLGLSALAVQALASSLLWRWRALVTICSIFMLIMALAQFLIGNS